jgi:DNA polymerase I
MIAKNTVEPDVIDESPSGDNSNTNSVPKSLAGTGFPDAKDTIELAVMQVNYSTRYLGQNQERATIHLFCRHPGDDRTQPIQVDVYGFNPFFYISKAEQGEVNTSKDEILGTKNNFSNSQKDRFTSIHGTELTRVYTDIPRTVGNIRDNFDHYEADVLLPDRFMIEKGIRNGIRVPARWVDETEQQIEVREDEIEAADVSTEPRVHAVDIEVDDRNGFPEPEDADQEVLCITAHDSWKDEYIVWYYDGNDVTEEVPDSVDDYEFIASDDTTSEVKILKFGSEDAMMNGYLSYLERTDPDLLVGWNVDDFDAEYLINRLSQLDSGSEFDISSDRMSRIGEVWGGGWRGPNIKGRVVFDLLEAYKRTQFTELDSYRLEAVGQAELGIGKERFDGDIGDLWESDPARLIEYNLRDVEICVELDAQQGIIDFWDEVRQFVGCRIQDAPIPSDAVDMYVLQTASGRFVLPSKGTVESGGDFEGGAVFDPITGIREMVGALDLKSLYPMSMVTTNASPETKVNNPDAFDGETYKTPNGIHFQKKPDGIMREMVDELLSEREKKKALRDEHDPGTPEYELYDRQQASVKVIMNSLYGVSGWDRFRLYDKDNASAVTATGREVINFTEKTVTDMGLEVTYGDTDSVLIELKEYVDDNDPEVPDELIGAFNKQADDGTVLTTTDEVRDWLIDRRPDDSSEAITQYMAALAVSHKLEKKINNAYDEFALDQLNAEEHRFQIEFEKLYQRFLQAGKKKRYAGNIIWKEGKDVDDIDITGFEYGRSDIAGITKTAQKGLIEQLVTGADPDDVRDEIHDLITRFENGEIPDADIGIPSGIGKPLGEYDTDTAHVRGAKYANLLLGTDFGQGSKPKRVYLQRVHPNFYQKVEGEMGLDPQRNPIYGEFKRDPDVICFIHDDQIPDEFEIDTEKMLSKVLQAPLARILRAVDITWEDVRSGQEQTNLENFM